MNHSFRKLSVLGISMEILLSNGIYIHAEGEESPQPADTPVTESTPAPSETPAETPSATPEPSEHPYVPSV